MRLIDADALMKELEREVELADDWKTAHEIANVVKYFPTIEPQRMRGKWIDQKGGGCCCSECGRYALDEPDWNFIHVAVKSNFCPHCGADMREGQDEAN